MDDSKIIDTLYEVLEQHLDKHIYREVDWQSEEDSEHKSGQWKFEVSGVYYTNGDDRYISSLESLPVSAIKKNGLEIYLYAEFNGQDEDDESYFISCETYIEEDKLEKSNHRIKRSSGKVNRASAKVTIGKDAVADLKRTMQQSIIPGILSNKDLIIEQICASMIGKKIDKKKLLIAKTNLEDVFSKNTNWEVDNLHLGMGLIRIWMLTPLTLPLEDEFRSKSLPVISYGTSVEFYFLSARYAGDYLLLNIGINSD